MVSRSSDRPVTFSLAGALRRLEFQCQTDRESESPPDLSQCAGGPAGPGPRPRPRLPPGTGPPSTAGGRRRPGIGPPARPARGPSGRLDDDGDVTVTRQRQPAPTLTRRLPPAGHWQSSGSDSENAARKSRKISLRTLAGPGASSHRDQAEPGVSGALRVSPGPPRRRTPRVADSESVPPAPNRPVDLPASLPVS